MPDVVHGIAVQIDQPAAGIVLEPSAVGPGKRANAGRGAVLVDEAAGIAADKRETPVIAYRRAPEPRAPPHGNRDRPPRSCREP
jgi:hypothetical protein